MPRFRLRRTSVSLSVVTALGKAYYANTMAQMDLEKERQRLAALYAAMQESELAEIAADVHSLTEIAREMLRAEMLRRGMTPAPETTSPMATDASKPEPPKPVMIRRYRDLPEASIAKSILDSAGIESFLIDDNLVRLDWFYSNLIGGIKLLVREEDAETAGKLLDQVVPEKFAVDNVGEYQQPSCPQCHSFEVSYDGLNKSTTYAALFLGLPIPVTDKGWKCHSCGHAWHDEADSSPGTPTEP